MTFQAPFSIHNADFYNVPLEGHSFFLYRAQVCFSPLSECCSASFVQSIVLSCMTRTMNGAFREVPSRSPMHAFIVLSQCVMAIRNSSRAIQSGSGTLMETKCFFFCGLGARSASRKLHHVPDDSGRLLDSACEAKQSGGDGERNKRQKVNMTMKKERKR